MFKLFKRNKTNQCDCCSKEMIELQRHIVDLLGEHQENFEDILSIIKSHTEAIAELRKNNETLQKLVSKNERLD